MTGQQKRHLTRHIEIDHGTNSVDPKDQLMDDERVSQVASQVVPQVKDPLIFKDPATLTEAERQSQEFFNTPERIKGIQDALAARAKMTEEERDEELEKMRLSMGILLKAIVLEMKKRGKQRGKPKGSYTSLDDEAEALAMQVAVPDRIKIGDDNDNDGRLQDQQECGNNPNDDLFSVNSDDDNDNNDPDDDNDPDDEYSQSTND